MTDMIPNPLLSLAWPDDRTRGGDTPDKITHVMWALRYDGSKRRLTHALDNRDADVRTFTEAPQFQDVLNRTPGYKTIFGGRDAAIQYNPDALTLRTSYTETLYNGTYGAANIQGVKMLIAVFTTLTVAIVHMPAHTGYSDRWLNSTPQETTSSRAYIAALAALPNICRKLTTNDNPVILAADWNKPINTQRLWRNRIEIRTPGLTYQSGKGVVADYTHGLKMTDHRNYGTIPTFDHVGYRIEYKKG